ncbi:extracellular solute-binding protein [Phytohabitans suffuscus]|uniref:ABC transporter substrate-binding protein n=1 Tax=Phytohabitans suffuscus TaxID=624315 RepID=A0A6F8YQ37_9ACTN|nr:extracellular solute-binding protein [Phytohabitans suffuscus]BCB88051.1 ABC transporter substrate-binding protein [Phytohabitans suffuscus]
MRHRIGIAAALAATLLGAAACGGSDEGGANDTSAQALDGKGKTIKVWLMVDAQSSWKEVVDDANARFTAATGANVTVEYQQWANHLTKLDATLAGNDVPDVVELGNTEMPKYVFSGAFAELDKNRFENSANWLQGLSGPCELDGKTYCVPYYAGARVLIYRTDLFEAAGVKAPTSYAELTAAADALKAKNGASKKFATFYMPGAYWYAAMSWVYAEGGQIAKKDGDKWTGTLADPQAQAGLQKWADLVKAYSAGDVTKDENDQAQIFAQGESAMFYGNGWEVGAAQEQRKDPNDPNSELVATKVKDKVAAAPMPGIPSFLGGSDIGVTAKSQNQALGAEWIKYFTDTKAQEALLAKAVLPNATNLLDKAATVKGNEATALAAKSSWFVPMAEKWADVEKAAVLQQMLRDIVTGKKSVADATAWADGEIEKTLNG